MPELPEVETIARTLTPQVMGRRLVGCTLLNASTLEGSLPLETVLGKQIGIPARRGKLLVLPFTPEEASYDAGHTADAAIERAPSFLHTLPEQLVAGVSTDVIGLAFHLKMTGRLFVYPQGTEPAKHTRVVFDLDDGARLFFDDARKFGYTRVVSPAVLAAWPFWQGLGLEPLECTTEAFVARLHGRKAAMKSLLLDQTLIAGCGNIYADESLFRAGIRPNARLVEAERLHLLHGALCEVLLESIAACGSSIRDYRTARGDAGAFQNSFRVYGRAGQRCLVCDTPLEHCRIAGRATVYCPACQRD